MSAASDFDTAMQAVATALGSADFATARRQLTIAEVHAGRLPQGTTTGSVSVQERALESIGKLREQIDEEESRADGPFFLFGETWVP